MTGMGNGMDPSSGMGGGEFGQMGDGAQYLNPNDLISQRSSPDFMPGGKHYYIRLLSVVYNDVVPHSK